MLKSKLHRVLLNVLSDHLDGTLDEDDVLSLSKDIVDELSSTFRDIEDDDGVFRANDIGFYLDEEDTNRDY